MAAGLSSRAPPPTSSPPAARSRASTSRPTSAAEAAFVWVAVPPARPGPSPSSAGPDGDEDLPDRAALDGRVCGGRVLEAEAVQRQPGVRADPECAAFDCAVDVGCGGGDQVPADR